MSSFNVPYPLRGVQQRWGFADQPEGTTPIALNARPLDAGTHRYRGGPRPGLDAYLESVGTGRIQGMTQLTTAVDDPS